MSLILDALKKSETERQEQGSAEFSSVPISSGNRSPARWLWLLAALLAVNFAVLIGILLKPDAASEEQPVAATNIAPVTQATTSPFEDRVASAIKERPTTTAPAPQASGEEAQAAAISVAPPVQRVAQPVDRSSPVVTIDELRLDGSLQLPELHLDIHVYSDDPAERFVFINMDKHREDSRIDAGAVVREITPDGVILEYQGRRFLLPRK